MAKIHNLQHDDIFLSSNNIDGIVEGKEQIGYISERKNELPTGKVIAIEQSCYPLSMAFVTNVYPFKYINGEALPNESLCFSAHVYAYVPENYPRFYNDKYNFQIARSSVYTQNIVACVSVEVYAFESPMYVTDLWRRTWMMGAPRVEWYESYAEFKHDFQLYEHEAKSNDNLVELLLKALLDLIGSKEYETGVYNKMKVLGRYDTMQLPFSINPKLNDAPRKYNGFNRQFVIKLAENNAPFLLTNEEADAIAQTSTVEKQHEMLDRLSVVGLQIKDIVDFANSVTTKGLAARLPRMESFYKLYLRFKDDGFSAKVTIGAHDFDYELRNDYKTYMFLNSKIK